jgi:hypothetical protein
VAHATFMTAPVELRDSGNGDRLTGIATARTIGGGRTGGR